MLYKKELSSSAKQRLDELYDRLAYHSAHFSGYPCNLKYDYSELLRFFEFSINNVGDPAEDSNYQVNTHEFECEVVDFFAGLMQIESGYRGYVTSGGTEGNLFGLYLGRQRYPDGVVYYSERTHYSVRKIIRLLNARSCLVPVQANGEIDYQQLAQALKKNRHLPAIFNINIGTTMTGAVDRLDKVQAVVAELGITDCYYHCDAALSGMILPFVDDPQPFKFTEGVHSISISGHKFVGSPLPCGVTIGLKENIDHLSPEIAYVKIVDSTITGSRNGHSALMLWYAIQRYGVEGFKELVQTCLENTRYAVAELNRRGIKAWSNKNANTVVFPLPNESVMKKWQLASHDDIAHIVVMPHNTREFLDRVIDDIVADKVIEVPASR